MICELRDGDGDGAHSSQPLVTFLHFPDSDSGFRVRAPFLNLVLKFLNLLKHMKLCVQSSPRIFPTPYVLHADQIETCDRRPAASPFPATTMVINIMEW